MPPLYALSCLLLSVAALQFHKTAPASVPPWVSLLGSAASLALVGMLIAGFFITTWWAPVVLFIVGPAVFLLIPMQVRRAYWDLILIGGSLGGMGAALVVLLD